MELVEQAHTHSSVLLGLGNYFEFQKTDERSFLFCSHLHLKETPSCTWRIDRNSNDSSTKTAQENENEIDARRIHEHNKRPLTQTRVRKKKQTNCCSSTSFLDTAYVTRFNIWNHAGKARNLHHKS